MYLDEFFDYKNQLMKDILTDEATVSLIEDSIDMEDAANLAYTRVFPYEYVPQTVDDGKTFVCFDVDIQRVSSKTFLTPVIRIWVFTHRSKMRLPEGGVRIDALCSSICKLINGSRFYGLGELNLSSVKRFAPMTDYQGKAMTFVAEEFNRTYPTGKAVPSNRKAGV